MTPEQTAEDLRARDEYDAFGPWVVRVRETADLPPLYTDARLEPGRDVVVKFPRPEARRDLLPGMDLYDAVLSAGSEALVVLQRDRGGAHRHATRVIPYAGLAAIVDSTDLLDARLEIHSTDGDVVVVPYNGSSKRTVGELIDELRSRIAAAVTPPPGWSGVPLPEPGTPVRLGMDDLGRKDVALVSLFDQVARGGGAVLLAAAGRSVARPVGAGARRAFEQVWPTSLQGMVIVASPSELQILTRRLPFRRGGRPETSLSRTILVAPLVTAVEIEPHSTREAVTLVTVRAGDAALPFAVPAASPLERALRALAPR
ncbi:hypothetical protein [Herbiconiux solani]|uniref:hypothetical protein n=1 Tax=Herbiconiux solani TaxID=661329 RepID=UPI0008264291|nr:hypothetical protein [Herbiconiux solani]